MKRNVLTQRIVCLVLILQLSLLTGLLFLSCSSGSFVNLGSLKTELNLKEFPEQKDYPDADALVLYELHNVKVYVDGNYDVRTIESITRVTKLFKNIEDYASIEINTSSGDKLTRLSARTIKPDGTVLELKSEDFHTISGGGDNYVFYSDRQTTKFTFPAIEKNCIVEYHYDIDEAYPFVQDEWRIQSNIPKLKNLYRLTAPVLLLEPESKGGAGWAWRYTWYNCDLGEPVVQQPLTASTARLDQIVTFEWSKTNVPPFKPDPMMPSYDNYLQYVKFARSEWKTWTDLSKWYYENHFKPKLVITDEITTKAKGLTDRCTSDKEKIEKIYRFVQKLRYVEISLGDGGYTPSEPQKVLDRQYGDCKDKSILLISLLQSLGIRAKPVLVLTSDEGIIHPQFTSWNFNHMIVKATTREGASYWIDPTVEYAPLGEIPYTDEGVNALVLNEDNTSQMETLPASSYMQNVEDINMVVNIPSGSEADFDITMKFKGQSNLYTRSFFEDKSHDDMIKFCKSLVADDYLNAEVVDYSYSNLDSVDSDLVFNFKLKVPNAIESQGDLLFLNIDPFKLRGDWSWLARDKRTYDIEFNYPRTVIKTIALSIPENQYEIRNIPQHSYLTGDGLDYFKDYENNGNGHLKVTETFSIRSKDIEAHSFAKVKNFIETMRTKAGEKIILTAKHN